MPLLRRRIRCHFCNQPSRDAVSGIPRTYQCRQCDAVNHLDEHGNIVDPPTHDTATPPATALHYATPATALHYATAAANPPLRSSSPLMPLMPLMPASAAPAPPAPLFCNACQRNQLLLNKTLAEYLPDEDDADYHKYADSLDAYRTELQDRYPQVCHRCLPRVQDQIRAAGYAAKADNLRRIIDRSREHTKAAHTSRQAWTLRLIALARCLYIASLVVGVLWHASSLTLHDTLHLDHHFSAPACLAHAFSLHPPTHSCLMSPHALHALHASLLADWLTIWWNPKLATKTDSITGRMRGLKSLWSIRAIVLALRTAAYLYWSLTPLRPWNLRAFHNTSILVLVAMTLSAALTWTTVRIVYTPVALPEEAYLPSAPTTPQPTKSTYKPAHPQTSTFDTMAHGFTSTFQAAPSSALPPSPTLTDASTTSHYTEFTTPARKSVHHDDSMDWTPTARRFAPAAPDILPPQFGSRSPVPPISPAPDRRHEPVSLFAKPDPNPFRHKVPPAPKPPAHARADPWKRAPWQPPLKDTLPNFFRTDRQTRSQTRSQTTEGHTQSHPSPNGLEGLGVPKNVQRDADLFATPKLKYDYYGTLKHTGLEDTFNGLFSG